MQALVLTEDRDAMTGISIALFKRGFQVVTADTVAHAMQYADLGVMDLVIMSERVQSQLSHSVALAAELRNADVTTMMITPRNDPDVDELYDLLPSLYGLFGPDLDAGLIAKVAVSGVIGNMYRADARLAAAEAKRVQIRENAQDDAYISASEMILEDSGFAAYAADRAQRQPLDGNDEIEMRPEAIPGQISHHPTVAA